MGSRAPANRLTAPTGAKLGGCGKSRAAAPNTVRDSAAGRHCDGWFITLDYTASNSFICDVTEQFLLQPQGGLVVWRDHQYRIVAADGPDNFGPFLLIERHR